MLPEQFVVVDVETTGLDSEKHEIIEIGAVRVHRDSNMHDTFTALIKPKKKISNKIIEITGITNEMLEQQGEQLNNVLSDYLKFIGDSRLVYFNAPFDHAFLSRDIKNMGVQINNPISCALDMARRAWPSLKSYKLSYLTKSLDTAGKHRALKDCELTISVYTAAAHKLRSVD
jgi:DNA polymerase III epsilon subunit family exonuclease